MKKARYTRYVSSAIVIAVIAGALVFAFRPRPVLVDVAAVSRGHFMQTIHEEARTRVHDAYVVSAPITGRLLRVELEPGDRVEQGKTLVARMLPSRPPALDIRQREQAEAAVKAAQAALGMAQANHQKTQADHRLAITGLERAEKQIRAAAISQAVYDQAQREADAATAALESARAQMSLREAELVNARAAFIGLGNEADRPADGIEIHAPVSGSILQVFQKSETIVVAGTPILEIGDIEDDLEIVVELLSSDAVKVKPGDPVLVENWGGEQTLQAFVDRVDPLGFTKISTLGVEEQRVNTRIRFSDQQALPDAALGHGFRVDVRIITAEQQDALMIPSSALLRQGKAWASFVVEDGIATLRPVSTSLHNGYSAVVSDGLNEGDRVVLYPPPELQDGAEVIER